MPNLSHSQLETFGQCAKKWRLLKIDRVPQAPSEHLLFGDAIHQAIESDGKRLMTGKPGLPASALLSIFAAALEYRAAKDDPDGLLAETLPDLRVRALATIAAYVAKVQPHYHPVAVEREFRFPVPTRDGWQFTGRIDAVTNGTGEPVIVDFKTATKPWPVGDEHHKPQASAYAWADDVLNGEIAHGVGKVVFIVLSTVKNGADYTCVPSFRATTRGTQDTAHYAGQVCEATRQLERATRENDFPASTGPLCAWCPVVASCAEGRDYLARTGRKIAAALPTSASQS